MGTDPESFHAGPLTRLLYVLLVKARNQKHLRRLWKPSPGLMSIGHVCIKVKPVDHLAEAHAMQFVAQRTSIPVPKVHCAFSYKGNSYTVMSRIRGQMAWQGWLGRTTESRARILGQLRRMVAELRSVHPPQGARVGNVDGGPFYDCRLPSKLFWGPFETVQDFHAALANDADLHADYKDLPHDLANLFEFYRQASNDLVLTHGDLSSLNIMVRGDEVVGVVDWETAGWFPPYWEYVGAKNANPQNAFWADEVDHFLDPMPFELEMERIRRKYFGAF